MKLALDTGVLGRLCHSKREMSQPLVKWMVGVLTDQNSGNTIYLPEICDYELRRKLLHLVKTGRATQRSIDRLNELAAELDYLPLTTEVMSRAAELWAVARSKGLSTSDERELDGDVILAAQAESVEAVVVTSNVRHLSRFVPAFEWEELSSNGKEPRT